MENNEIQEKIQEIEKTLNSSVVTGNAMIKNPVATHPGGNPSICWKPEKVPKYRWARSDFFFKLFILIGGVTAFVLLFPLFPIVGLMLFIVVLLLLITTVFF